MKILNLEKIVLKEDEIYRIDFEINDEEKSEYYFYFMLEDNIKQNRIIFKIIKNLTNLKQEEVEFLSLNKIKNIHENCKKCSKYTICKMIEHNHDLYTENKQYYAKILYFLFKKYYNCNQYIKGIDDNIHFKILQAGINNLKLSLVEGKR